MGDPGEPLHRLLRDALLEARAPDGGFGWAREADAEAEPTALAAIALDDEAARGWLIANQGDDGGFSLPTGFVEASAVTPLAALALDDGEARRRALDHVESTRARRVEDSRAVEGAEGWGWTPDTYSWVEPTARSMLALRLLRPESTDAIDEARSVLAGREVEGGGWNYGNADVLGTDLKPYVQTSAAAVMALQGEGSGLLDRGREFLAVRVMEERGGLSLAMALVAFRLTGGGEPAGLVMALGEQYERTGFLGNLGSLAWAVLATGPSLERLRVPT